MDLRKRGWGRGGGGGGGRKGMRRRTVKSRKIG